MSQKVMVTGASHGIGKQTALLLSREGYELVLTYNQDRQACEDVAQECGEDTKVVQLDLRDDASMKGASKENVSVLINNAGVGQHRMFTEMGLDDIEGIIRTNLEGTIKFTLLMLKHVTDRVINIGSGASKHGIPGMSVYCASKFGLRGFTEAMSRGSTGLRFHLVNPGMTKTRMTGYKGARPEEVAEVVVDTVNGKYKGWEIDV